MKKTFALILACCLLTGCSFNSEISDFGESTDNSYISSQSSEENSSEESYSKPITESAASSSTSDSPESVSPDTSSEPDSVPASSSSKPQSSSSSSSKPQSTASKPQSSSSSSSKPQSTASKPQSSSSSSSKPQSTASKPQSSSSSSSKPQSTASKPQSIASKPQSSSKLQSSSTASKPVEPEVIGPYGMRTQEDWEVEFADEVFRLTNIERVKYGLPEFKRLPLLDEVADIRAWELIPFYSHDRPDGRDCFTAFDEAGIEYSYAAENIAAGYRTPEEVVDGWMNSPGHRKNILSPSLKYLGTGFYYDKDGIGGSDYRYFWSQNFCSTWD